MFNYTLKNFIIEEEYSYFESEFSNDKDIYIEKFRVWNNNKEMEIETLINTQIKNIIEKLNILEKQYDCIFDKEGFLNNIKNNE